MPWTTPVSPVSGTVITVAWATANVVNPQNWLRLMTGNSDPPGSSYVVVSGSTTSTAWGKVTSDVLADGAVTALKIPDGSISNAKLVGGTAALNLAGTTVTGVVTISGSDAGLVIHGSAGMLNDGAAGTTLSGPGPQTLGGTGGVFITNTAGMLISGAAGLTVTSTNGVSVTNTLNAGTLQQGGAGIALASHVTHASSPVITDGQVIQFTNTLAPKINLFSTTFGIGINSGQLVLFAPAGNPVVVRDGAYNGTLLGQVALQNAAGKVPAALTADNALAIADGAVSTTNKIAIGIITSAHIADGTLIAADFNSGYVDGFPASPSIRTLGAGANQAAPGDHTHAGALLPSGLIAAFPTAAAIASGWTRYTAADGRLLIGAGTSLSVLWTEGTNYGTSWSHDHVTSTVTAASAFSGTAGTAGASGTTQQSSVATPNPNVSLGTHTHPFTPAGTVSTTLSGNVGDTSWQPAMRGIVWAQKT